MFWASSSPNFFLFFFMPGMWFLCLGLMGTDNNLIFITVNLQEHKQFIRDQLAFVRDIMLVRLILPLLCYVSFTIFSINIQMDFLMVIPFKSMLVCQFLKLCRYVSILDCSLALYDIKARHSIFIWDSLILIELWNCY